MMKEVLIARSLCALSPPTFVAVLVLTILAPFWSMGMHAFLAACLVVVVLVVVVGVRLFGVCSAVWDALPRYKYTRNVSLLRYSLQAALDDATRGHDWLLCWCLLKAGATPGRMDGVRSPAVIRLLLRHGANPNVEDSDGWSILGVAAMCDYLAMAETLLDGGADPNIHSDGRFGGPLHLAKSAEMQELLILHGANPELRNARGKTPDEENAGKRDGRHTNLIDLAPTLRAEHMLGVLHEALESKTQPAKRRKI